MYKAKNTPKRDDWQTPKYLFDFLARHTRGFVCDIAATPENALCERYLADSLNCNWPTDGWNFCNPPFSKKIQFVAKAIEQQEIFGARTAMVLPSNNMDQKWIEDILDRGYNITIIIGRVRYNAPDGVKASQPPFGTMIVLFEESHQGSKIYSIRNEDIKR